jgi:hypothetical protein
MAKNKEESDLAYFLPFDIKEIGTEFYEAVFSLYNHLLD